MLYVQQITVGGDELSELAQDQIESNLIDQEINLANQDDDDD